jgi:predicted permease
VGNLFRDLSYTLRTLRKNPGFTSVALLTLALGIGVNTSIFSLYNAIALRPIPVKDPSRIVRLFQTTRGESGAGVLSYPQYEDFRDHGTVLAGLAAWAWTGLSMGTSSQSENLSAMYVSGNYFDVLGAEVAIGRTFLPEEGRTPGSNPVVVLSYKFWERRFARDPALVGRTILLNGHAFTVVGVAGRSFVGTDAVTPQAWVPIMMRGTLSRGADDALRDRQSHWLEVIGRLKPGVSRGQADAALNVLAGQLGRKYPEESKSGIELDTATFLPPDAEKESAPIVILAMGAVALILLIACANVANLTLARSAGRQKELGIRLSVGATPRRLMRQLLTESIVIAMLGGAIGLLLATWAPFVLLRIATPPFEEGLNFDVSPDIRVLGYAFAISIATGIIFGLIPALSASRTGVSELIKAAVNPRHRTRASDSFVAAQVGLCVVLLVAGGLLLRALRRAQTTDPGFDTKHVVAVSLDLRLHRYDDRETIAFERRVADRLRSMPGVTSVSLAGMAPLGTAFMATDVTIDGRENRPDAAPLIVSQNVVSPEFFTTLGIAVLRGRSFNDADCNAGPEVAIVNETLARRLWPVQQAIGKRLKAGGAKNGWREIVGVVKNTRSTYLWADSEPYLYTPATMTNSSIPDVKILVRTAGAPQPLLGALPGVVRTLDQSVQVSVKVLEENLETWIWPSRVGAILAAAFGILALTLAVVGIYGVVAYTVSRRTHEIGIRVALGAQPPDVLRVVLGRGMLLVGIGVTAGLAGGFAVSRLIAQFLYGLSPADPFTFAGVTVVLVSAALLAHYVPARRALRVDPMVALRYE